MLPLLVPVAIIGLAVWAFGGKKAEDNSKKPAEIERPEFAKIPKSKLPEKIRFYDDGRDIKSRKYELYRSDKWEVVSKKLFDWIHVYGGGNDDVEYNRKKKSEDGKFVFYLNK